MRAYPVVQLGKNPLADEGDARDLGLVPGSGRSPGEGNWQPSYGQRSLAGYSPWGPKESDAIEHTCTHLVMTGPQNLDMNSQKPLWSEQLSEDNWRTIGGASWPIRDSSRCRWFDGLLLSTATGMQDSTPKTYLQSLQPEILQHIIETLIIIIIPSPPPQCIGGFLNRNCTRPLI